MKPKRRKSRRRTVSHSSVLPQRLIQLVPSDRLRKLPTVPNQRRDVSNTKAKNVQQATAEQLLKLKCALAVCITIVILIQSFITLYELFVAGHVPLPLDNTLLLIMIKFIMSAR